MHVLPRGGVDGCQQAIQFVRGGNNSGENSGQCKTRESRTKWADLILVTTIIFGPPLNVGDVLTRRKRHGHLYGCASLFPTTYSAARLLVRLSFASNSEYLVSFQPPYVLADLKTASLLVQLDVVYILMTERSHGGSRNDTKAA